MPEQEMRAILQKVCADLDRRVRTMGRGLSKAGATAVLGAGLMTASAACDGDTDPPITPVADVVDGSVSDSGSDIQVQPLYAAPFDASVDINMPETALLYAAPFDAGAMDTNVPEVQPLYAAPFDAGVQDAPKDMTIPEVQPLYAAPFDGGPMDTGSQNG